MICILYGCTGSGKTWYLQNHLLEKIDHPLVYCSVLSSEREWRNKSVFSVRQLTLVKRLPEVLSLTVLDINDRYQLLAPIVTELLQLKDDYNFYICLSKYHSSLESLFKAAEHIVFFANSEGAITDLPQECLPDANALHEISEFIKYLMSIGLIHITEVNMRFLHLVLQLTVCSIITGVLSAFTHLRLLFSISVLLSIPGFAYIAFVVSTLIVLIIIELLHKFRRVNH